MNDGEITDAEKEAATTNMLRDMEADGMLHEAVAPMDSRFKKVEDAARKRQAVLVILFAALCLAGFALWDWFRRQLASVRAQSVGPAQASPDGARKPIGFAAHQPLPRREGDEPNA